MQQRPLGLFTTGLILFSLTIGTAVSQDAAPAPEPKAPPAEPSAEAEPQSKPSPVLWDGNRATLGSVQVDAAAKTVTATGWVNQIEGLVEVLACGPKGKVHESVFVLSLNPLDLQAALLLIGLQAGTPMETGSPPAGAPVDLIVEWEADGETKQARAETFLWHQEEDRALPETPWTFNGSIVRDGEFMALAEESLVVTYWDRYAILNLPLPCGANDELLVVNTNTVPPYETPVTFHFVPKK